MKSIENTKLCIFTVELKKIFKFLNKKRSFLEKRYYGFFPFLSVIMFKNWVMGNRNSLTICKSKVHNIFFKSGLELLEG